MSDMKVGVKFEVEKSNFKGDVKQNGQAVEQFGQSSRNVSKQVGGMAASTNKAAISNKKLGHISTQLGFQLQDVAVQAQSGTNAFVILGQQGSQIASIFGPGGAVFGAVLAIGSAIGGTLYSSMFKATEKGKELTRSLDEILGRQNKIEAKRLSKDIEVRTKRLAELKKQVATIYKTISHGYNQKLGLIKQGEVDDAIKDMQKLGGEITLIQARLDEVNAKSGNDEADSLLAGLKQQAFLTGQVTNVARVRYELEQGSLKNISDSMKKQILLQANIIDLKERAIAKAEQEKQQADESNKAATRYLESLKRQTSLHEQKTAVAKLGYELEFGSLQHISPALRTKLELQAQELDKLSQKQTILAQLSQLERDILKPTTAEGRENQTHNGRMATLNNTLDITPESEVEQRQRIHALIEAEHLRHKQAIASIEASKKVVMMANAGQLFNGLAGLTKSFAGKQSGIYKTMFGISKAFAIAESIIKIQQGIASAAALPFPANIPAIESVTSMTAGIISTIKGAKFQGQAHNGLARVPAGNEGTWMLRKDEMVLNPKQRDNFEYLVKYAKANSQQAASASDFTFQNQNHFAGGSMITDEQIEQAVFRLRESIYEANEMVKNDRMIA